MSLQLKLMIIDSCNGQESASGMLSHVTWFCLSGVFLFGVDLRSADLSQTSLHPKRELKWE